MTKVSHTFDSIKQIKTGLLCAHTRNGPHFKLRTPGFPLHWQVIWCGMPRSLAFSASSLCGCSFSPSFWGLGTHLKSCNLITSWGCTLGTYALRDLPGQSLALLMDWHCPPTLTAQSSDGYSQTRNAHTRHTGKVWVNRVANSP